MVEGDVLFRIENDTDIPSKSYWIPDSDLHTEVALWWLLPYLDSLLHVEKWWPFI